jgi:outer membrane protein assembly factor BamB
VTREEFRCHGEFETRTYWNDEVGVTHVVYYAPEFDIIGKNTLCHEMYWASPAMAGGALIMRGVDHIYCIKP